jgi:acetamidase/formamidase
MLRIDIKKIDVVGHGSGCRYNSDSEELDYDGNIIDFIELKDGYAVMPGGLHTRIEPMIGVICLVPKLDEGENITDRIKYDLGNVGGNMDYKDITEGNSLCLKAEHEGGLIFIGDCHAGQGWGEWMGVGIECAADVTVCVEKEESFVSDRPVLLKDKSYTCIACGWPYADAVNLAMDDAAKILAALAKTDYANAARYCKLLGNVKNGMICHLGFNEMPDGKPISDCPLVVGVEVPFPINI